MENNVSKAECSSNTHKEWLAALIESIQETASSMNQIYAAQNFPDQIRRIQPEGGYSTSTSSSEKISQELVHCDNFSADRRLSPIERINDAEAPIEVGNNWRFENSTAGDNTQLLELAASTPTALGNAAEIDQPPIIVAPVAADDYRIQTVSDADENDTTTLPSATEPQLSIANSEERNSVDDTVEENKKVATAATTAVCITTATTDTAAANSNAITTTTAVDFTVADTASTTGKVICDTGTRKSPNLYISKYFQRYHEDSDGSLNLSPDTPPVITAAADQKTSLTALETLAEAEKSTAEYTSDNDSKLPPPYRNTVTADVHSDAVSVVVVATAARSSVIAAIATYESPGCSQFDSTSVFDATDSINIANNIAAAATAVEETVAAIDDDLASESGREPLEDSPIKSQRSLKDDCSVFVVPREHDHSSSSCDSGSGNSSSCIKNNHDSNSSDSIEAQEVVVVNTLLATPGPPNATEVLNMQQTVGSSSLAHSDEEVASPEERISAVHHLSPAAADNGSEKRVSNLLPVLSTPLPLHKPLPPPVQQKLLDAKGRLTAATSHSKQYLQDLLEDPTLTAADHNDFETLWNTRKMSVEKAAEHRARNTFRTWQRNGVPIKAAIDSALREYSELYERAHAVRLLFEAEKEEWQRGLMADRLQLMPPMKQARIADRASASSYYDTSPSYQQPSYFNASPLKQQQWTPQHMMLSTEGDDIPTAAAACHHNGGPDTGGYSSSWWSSQTPVNYSTCGINGQFEYITGVVEETEGGTAVSQSRRESIMEILIASAESAAKRPPKKFNVPMKKP